MIFRMNMWIFTMQNIPLKQSGSNWIRPSGEPSVLCFTVVLGTRQTYNLSMATIIIYPHTFWRIEYLFLWRSQLNYFETLVTVIILQLVFDILFSFFFFFFGNMQNMYCVSFYYYRSNTVVQVFIYFKFVTEAFDTLTFNR